MPGSVDISTLPAILSTLGMQLDGWTPDNLRDVAAQCRHRAAGLRRLSAWQEDTGEGCEGQLRRADEFAAAGVLCEIAASRMSSAA